MKNILPLLPRPSHFLGIEEGAVHKDPGAVDLHCVLAFPDMYEVGMSYLGQKILYGILNQRTDTYAERVFAPSLDAGLLLRELAAPLCTLESDTPLAKTHLVGFAITHELCYTNVLYMLDLAGIPLRAADRGDDLAAWPVILAGGGCTLCAEPLAPFMDLMVLGEGEDALPEVCALLRQARHEGWSRTHFLAEAARQPGVYVPSLFAPGPDGGLAPVDALLPRPARRIVADLDRAVYPSRQVVPFGAVHNRLSLEIARGCTRGCRFCQAGMTYRPARERSLPVLSRVLESCLADTGFDEVSFLSLSTGDFSGLKGLFLSSCDRCAAEQIAVSLPSLRVGSIDDDIMRKVAGIRRTGATLAPEAGSQRLRDVINKGVTEEGLLVHVQKLFEHGWQQVKLYFMIGLPTETDADLDAIIDLCRKVRDAAGRGMPRLQVTAAVSPFVPKPHTPFQWEAQISMDEITRRVHYLREGFKREKCLKMRWHEPAMSTLEGLLSRGDRRLANVVERAYRSGAVFASWMEHFALEPWIEALAAEGLNLDEYTGPRDVERPLVWDHLEAGVSREFLLRERQRALEEKLTEDCRYHACRHCGACDTSAGTSRLAREGEGVLHANRLNFPQRDQAEHQPLRDEEGRLVVRKDPADTAGDEPSGGRAKPPALAAALGVKAMRYRIWHAKEGGASFLSQLELQSVIDRALRRAGIPMAFSQGFHPMPLISFGRALPVGVQSLAEWFSVILRRPLRPDEVQRRLEPFMLRGLRLDRVELIPVNDKSLGAERESFLLRYSGPEGERFREAWDSFSAETERLLTRETKKGPRTSDIRPLFERIERDENGVFHLEMDWMPGYVSPLTLARAVTPWAGVHEIGLVKLRQELA